MPDAIERDPASTLDFSPPGCSLRLEGRYAMEQALPNPPLAAFVLTCQQAGDPARVLVIRYQGPEVSAAPIADLVDSTVASGAVGTVTYALEGSRAGRLRFRAGELRFRAPPRALLDPASDAGPIEVDLELHFEGEKHFRASLRMCPTYEDQRAVSDPPG